MITLFEKVCALTWQTFFKTQYLDLKKTFHKVLDTSRPTFCLVRHVLSFTVLRRYSYPEWLTDIHIVLSSINIAVFHFIQNFALPTVIIHRLYSVNTFKKTNSLQPKCSSSSIKSVSKERLCPHCMCMIVCFVKACLSLNFTCFL